MTQIPLLLNRLSSDGNWGLMFEHVCVCVSYVSRTCDKKRFRYCKLLNYTYKIDNGEC